MGSVCLCPAVCCCGGQPDAYGRAGGVRRRMVLLAFFANVFARFTAGISSMLRTVSGPSLPQRFRYSFTMKSGNGSFHGFLRVIVELAELLWVEAQFASHLHMCMRKPELPSCIDPGLQNRPAHVTSS